MFVDAPFFMICRFTGEITRILGFRLNTNISDVESDPEPVGSATRACRLEPDPDLYSFEPNGD
jgi:hypothetical protein